MPGLHEYLRQMRSTLRTLGHVPLDTLSDSAKDALTAAFRSPPGTQARNGPAPQSHYQA